MGKQRAAGAAETPAGMKHPPPKAAEQLGQDRLCSHSKYPQQHLVSCYGRRRALPAGTLLSRHRKAPLACQFALGSSVLTAASPRYHRHLESFTFTNYAPLPPRPEPSHHAAQLSQRGRQTVRILF